MNLAFKLAQADAAGLKRLPGSLHVNRRLDQWLRWQGRSAEDGRLLVFSGKVDIGQGLSTALAQIVAEELQLALWQVQMQPARTGVSPDEAVTSGSLSIQESGTALRWACAEVRALYLAAAARRWGLPDDAATLASLQVHEGRIAAPAGLGNVSKLALAPLCYWQLAADPDFIDLLDREASGEVAPRAVSAHVLVGQSLPRQDLPAKLLGQGGFVHDLRLPQMLFARVVRAPSPGARLLALNAEAMLQRLSPAQRQQVAVVQDGQFVAVVAEQEALAVRARSLLQSAMQWQEQATLPDEHAMDEFLLSQTPERLDSSIVAQRQPEASTKSLQPATPAIALQAQYSRPYIAHASIVPSCAIAQWQPLPEETPGASATHGLARQVTLWSHSQGPYNLRTDLALTLGLTPEQVVVQHCEGAGCYGHNGADDVALDAALAARDLPAHWRGRPVQLQWMREDESETVASSTGSMRSGPTATACDPVAPRHPPCWLPPIWHSRLRVFRPSMRHWLLVAVPSAMPSPVTTSRPGISAATACWTCPSAPRPCAPWVASSMSLPSSASWMNWHWPASRTRWPFGWRMSAMPAPVP